METIKMEADGRKWFANNEPTKQEMNLSEEPIQGKASLEAAQDKLKLSSASIQEYNASESERETAKNTAAIREMGTEGDKYKEFAAAEARSKFNEYHKNIGNSWDSQNIYELAAMYDAKFNMEELKNLQAQQKGSDRKFGSYDKVTMDIVNRIKSGETDLNSDGLYRRP